MDDQKKKNSSPSPQGFCRIIPFCIFSGGFYNYQKWFSTSSSDGYRQQLASCCGSLTVPLWFCSGLGFSPAWIFSLLLWRRVFLSSGLLHERHKPRPHPASGRYSDYNTTHTVASSSYSLTPTCRFNLTL